MIPIKPKKGILCRQGRYGRCSQVVRTKPSPTARVKLILATPKTGWIVHILKLSGGENDKNREELRIHKDEI